MSFTNIEDFSFEFWIISDIIDKIKIIEKIIIDLFFRINFLKESGVVLNQDAMDYALESINDWIIFENDLNVECKTHRYQVEQKLKQMGITMK